MQAEHLALRREDLLLARLGSHQRRVDRAQRLITSALEACPHWLVAFSGGKDSLLTLALLQEVAGQSTALWTDDELEHDEQLTSIPATAAALGSRLVVKTGTQEHAGWFRPWSELPPWHDPLPDTIVTGERASDVTRRLGFGGTMLGLRKDEAAHRRIYLVKRGPLHQLASGAWRCFPLAGWSVADVWAEIARRELPYSPVYDVLTRIGVPRGDQRVGPLPLADGWQLRRGWPEIYERLLARYGRMWGCD